jgi:ferredoxin
MNAVRDSTSNLPTANFHFEAFESTADAAEARPFAIKLASSGNILQVPAQASILEVLRANAVDIPSSCETGSCGTCVIGYHSGDVDHHDFCLTPAERKRQLAVCVSRARSAQITLDL